MQPSLLREFLEKNSYKKIQSPSSMDMEIFPGIFGLNSANPGRATVYNKNCGNWLTFFRPNCTEKVFKIVCNVHAIKSL